MSENSAEIDKGRTEEIKRQFTAIYNSDEAKELSVSYMQEQGELERSWARMASALNFKKNGWQFMFQHYAPKNITKMTRYPILENGKTGVKGAITINLGETITGEEYMSDSPDDDPKHLSSQESIEKAEEILTSYASAKPN